MLKYGGTAFLVIAILVNGALAAWALSGDPNIRNVVLGLLNLGAATFCTVVLAKFVADWKHL